MAKMWSLAKHNPRLAAVVGTLLISAGLWIGGAQSFAVGLIPPPWDKFAHAGIFMAISALAGFATGLRGWRMIAAAICSAAVVGVVDELHQTTLPGRSASLADLAADMIGAIVGAVGLWAQRERRNKQVPTI
jgi:hypothetical protein